MKKSVLSSLLCLVIIVFTACSNELVNDVSEDLNPSLKSVNNVDYDVVPVSDFYLSTSISYSDNGMFGLSCYDRSGNYPSIVEITDDYVTNKKYWSFNGVNTMINMVNDGNVVNETWAIALTFYVPATPITSNSNICSIYGYNDGFNILGNIYLSQEDGYVWAKWYENDEPECLTDVYPGHYHLILIPDYANEVIRVYITGAGDDTLPYAIDAIKYYGIENMQVVFPMKMNNPDVEFLNLGLGGMEYSYNFYVPEMGTAHTYIGDVEIFKQSLLR